MPESTHRLDGRAIVRDHRRHKAFLASGVEVHGQSVTFTGSLRHRDAVGVRFYPPRTRTLPLSAVSIEWLKSEGLAA